MRRPELPWAASLNEALLKALIPAIDCLVHVIEAWTQQTAVGSAATDAKLPLVMLLRVTVFYYVSNHSYLRMTKRTKSCHSPSVPVLHES